MNRPDSYLVISRGQWDTTISKQDIQAAIDDFYIWIERCISDGSMISGSRLGAGGAVVNKDGILIDGPYGEGKEVIGGYWHIIASSLPAAAELASHNPCLKYGIILEIRPTDPERASAFIPAVETPSH